MYHELIAALLGHTGDVFQPETFELSSGFPLLHVAERAVLGRLAQLGKKYAAFQDYINTRSSLQFEMTLKASINTFLEEYRFAVVSLEEEVLESKMTVSMVQSRLDRVICDIADLIVLLAFCRVAIFD